ncbi:MAG TPA: PilN domain-containing protein [Deltaproteobacteria bacterium]|jgi:type IV pilus assembly protein PilN|nr:PilN domain-containing protein [Deltaproteobacteria bacterium]HRW79295.1 PilN domain-containing protein [Desulfomonilia bacterium]HNQ84797.1 PilN domain-containing protein [Deltaproteobacteria bacterium]HNS89601.1 PilN domain-containing protein [Deltaproteobacteria bacterium]HOA44152.1 PilN domain-containing protein [Deltaproteobacteria bacterium]
MVKVNLLPIRVELRKKALVEHLILLMLCIALALIGAYFVQHAITQQREALKQEVADTKVEIKRLTAEAGEIEKFKQQKQELERKLDVIRELNAQKTGPVEMLDELSLIIPEKAWLSSITNKGATIVLEGSAVDNTTIATFMKQLQASKHFDNVTLVLSKQESGAQKFSITCKIKLTT